MGQLTISNCSVVTHGYDVHNDTILPSQIFNIHDVPTAYGMAIPSITQIQRKNATDVTHQSFDSLEALIKSRLAYLQINHQVNKIEFGRFRYDRYTSKAGLGLNLSNSSSEAKGETVSYHSITHEEKLFDVSMANIPRCKSSYTNDFIAAIAELPTGLSVSDEYFPGQPTWEQFFKRWGAYVVTKASGGGSFETIVDSDSLGEEFQDKNKIEAHLKIAYNTFFINNFLEIDAGKDTKDIEGLFDFLSKSTMNVIGGSTDSRNFVSSNNQREFNAWKNSLQTHPKMLTTNMVLEPITTFVKIVDPKKYPAALRNFRAYVGLGASQI